MGYYYDKEDIDLDYFMWRTISDIKVSEHEDEVVFTFTDQSRVMMYHSQDCCETVYLADVTGDFDSIKGSPVLRVFENTQDGSHEEGSYGSRLYTFYTITTFDASVTLRWIGESNGYYSVGVSMCKL